MKKLIAVLIGFVVATAIAYVKGADLTAALVVGIFYTVPIAITMVLPPWGPGGMVVIVGVAMLLAGPSAPRDQEEGLVAAWGYLWVWVTLAAVIVTLWTWVEQRRSRRKTAA